MSLSPRFHPICSSGFITKTWLSYFELREVNLNSTLFVGFDFRNSGQSFFTLMRDQCQSSKEIVENAIRSFKTRRLVTLNCLSRTQFNDESSARLKRLDRQTIKSSMNLLELIRSSIHTNHLVSDLFTNVGFFSKTDNQTSKRSLQFYFRSLSNGSCSCAYSYECVRPQGFYLQSDDGISHPREIIPGLVLGCYTIDSLLFSTLECLFEQTCIKLIIDMYDFNASGLFQRLDIETTRIRALRIEDSRFSPNTTLESIVSQLFIEDWRSSKNFTAYYNRCAPNQCTYTLTRRFDKAYMVTIMLGFSSGLMAVLELILPPFVSCMRRRWKKHKDSANCRETTGKI